MILGIIPARKGSKRLPGKNTRMLCGKPLIAWTIEAALTCGSLDALVVSSDDPEVHGIADQWGVSSDARPDWLATDTASIYDVIRYTLKLESYHRPTHVMLLQPTSPLRTADDIDAFVASRNRIDADGLYVREDAAVQSCMRGDTKANGAMYLAPAWLWRIRTFNFDTRHGVQKFEMDPAKSVDINTIEDFEACERYLISMKAAA